MKRFERVTREGKFLLSSKQSVSEITAPVLFAVCEAPEHRDLTKNLTPTAGKSNSV